MKNFRDGKQNNLDVHIVHEVALTAHSVARFRDPAAGALLAN
jgi:hypothetical protein